MARYAARKALAAILLSVAGVGGYVLPSAAAASGGLPGTDVPVAIQASQVAGGDLEAVFDSIATNESISLANAESRPASVHAGPPVP